MESNARLSQRNQELSIKIQNYQQKINGYEHQEKMLKREKKDHVGQVENLYFQIMQLESQMKRQKDRFSSRQKKLTQIIGEERRKVFKSSKEVH